MFNNEGAANALCAGVRVNGCNTEHMSLQTIPGVCVCVRVHACVCMCMCVCVRACVCTCERLIGVLMYVPLACVFIFLLVFCGQTFKIVKIIFFVCV